MNFLKTLLISVLFAFAGLAAAATPVNLNSASVEQLVELNGIGPAKAQAIIAYRQEHGPFKSVEQLANVKGIGLKLVEKNRDVMSVGVVKATPASAAVAKAAPASKP